ncbi:MAG: DNA repair protein RecO [Clostridia bacterium]|nr:DNA repair protein RecO [Clostridia bacterium]
MGNEVLAVVTRTVNYRDNDRILTLVTRTRGRVTATARACRKPQSKLMPCAQLFCYGEFECYEQLGQLYIRSCDLHRNFYELRLDPDALIAASWACAVSEAFANPEEEYTKQFSLLLYTLQALCALQAEHKAVLAFFAVKQLAFCGYQPQADVCVDCGSTEQLTGYNAELGGVLCHKCAPIQPGTKRLSPMAVHMLANLPGVPSAAYHKIEKSLVPVAGELLPVLARTIEQFTDRKLPSLLFSTGFGRTDSRT